MIRNTTRTYLSVTFPDRLEICPQALRKMYSVLYSRCVESQRGWGEQKEVSEKNSREIEFS
jgi:hypothetical protein